MTDISRTSIRLEGNQVANGSVYCSGSKNAILPMLCCSLMTDQTLEIKSVPYIEDIRVLLNILAGFGVQIELVHSNTLKLRADNILINNQALAQVTRMRASIMLLGPLLTRFPKVKMPFPGGCALGDRPVNYHLEIMRQLGVEVSQSQGHFEAITNNGLTGANVNLPFPSVTSTENALLAMALAKGESRISNASTEYEVIETARILKMMGAVVEGEGTSEILVQGVDKLNGCTITPMADRIECGTWMALAVATGGNMEITNAPVNAMEKVIELCSAMGARVSSTPSTISIHMNGARPKAVSFSADVNQQFPTDLQPMFSTINAIATGNSKVSDSIFQNRFAHIESLVKMGAKIDVSWPHISIAGVNKLKGTEIQAQDLRGAASLVIAACCADGVTHIKQAGFLDRGYEFFEEKLGALGINMSRSYESTSCKIVQ